MRSDAALMDSADRDAIEYDLLSEYGSTNQRERWEHDLLPEDELFALARSVLFAPFAEFRRWQKLQTNDVKHDKSCTGGAISFSTREAAALAADEWSLFKKITVAVSVANNATLHKFKAQATVELVEHVGRCSVCPAEVFGRAASIRIEWAGRPLSREYTLEAR